MSSKWIQAARPQEHPFFSKLPPETRDEVLSHLPWREISALRRGCQELHDIVAGYESHFATTEINRHMRRLQDKIDAITNARMPTDAESLLSGLAIYTSSRGIFQNPEVALNSLEKWFSHLADDQIKTKHPQPVAEFDTWALLATQVIRLQIQVEAPRRTEGFVLPSQEEHWTLFKACISSIDDLPLSETEARALFDRIRADSPLIHRGIRKPIHMTAKEHTTFPGHHNNNFRLTPIRIFVSNEDKPEGVVRGPLLPAKILCGYLGGLPKLPGSDTFCYGVTTGWVTRLLRQHYKRHPHGGEMNPSMKAAALEWVKVF